MLYTLSKPLGFDNVKYYKSKQQKRDYSKF